MNDLIPHLLKRKNYLEQLLIEITRQRQIFPEGNLRVRNDGGIPRYYHIVEAGDTAGKYLTKKEKEIARQLAQKDYENKLYDAAEKELTDINVYLRKYGQSKLEKVYSDMNEYRKCLVDPLVMPDDMFEARWQEEPYEVNPYTPEEKVYHTKKGELVRSKSEVMLADMYYELGIPYRYEAQLLLKNGKKKYPDFTLLKTKTREIIYHEHLGLMDHEQYRQMNLAKLDEYRRNGIYPGKNLIITYEGEGSYLNIREIRQMVKELWNMA